MLLGNIGNFNQKRSVVFWEKGSSAACRLQMLFLDQFTNMNPSEAKKAGRKVLLRKDWEQIKMSVMAGIVKAKFEQNEELAKKLLATGDAYLEEGNEWGDRIWGTVNGQGANCLGMILMNTREELAREREKTTRKPK